MSNFDYMRLDDIGHTRRIPTTGFLKAGLTGVGLLALALAGVVYQPFALHRLSSFFSPPERSLAILASGEEKTRAVDDATLVLKDLQRIMQNSSLPLPTSDIFTVEPDRLFRCQQKTEGINHRLAWGSFVSRTRSGFHVKANPGLHYGKYSEFNPTVLERSHTTILQPCNAASSIVYYQLALMVCEGNFPSLSRQTIQATSLMAYGSATMHATETGFGASIDTTAIRLIFDVQTASILRAYIQGEIHPYVAGADEFTTCLSNKVGADTIPWTNPYKTTDELRSHFDLVTFPGCQDTVLWVSGGLRALTDPLGFGFVTDERERADMVDWRNWLRQANRSKTVTTATTTTTTTTNHVTNEAIKGVSVKVHSILAEFFRALLFQEKVLPVPAVYEEKGGCHRQRHTIWHLLSASVLQDIAELTSQLLTTAYDHD